MDGGMYLGAFRAFSGISDAVVLNHTPVGCSWGAGMFKMFSDQSDVRHASTVLSESEIIFGGESLLRSALIRAERIYESPLMIVLAGDASSIIGDDIEEIIGSTNHNRKVLWLEAPSIKGSMKQGYEEALLRLVSLMKESKKVENSVNLIGLCPDDFKVRSDIKEMKRMLEQIGVSVNCVISHCRYQELEHAPAAELNITLGQGITLAEAMKKEFGLPYIQTDYPYGIEGSKKFLNAVGDHLGTGNEPNLIPYIETFKRIYIYLQKLRGLPVTLIGDSRVQSLADFLDEELGLDIEVLASNDDYSAFENKIRDSSSIMIFGSSFERGLAREMKIPLLRVFYPVFDQICIYDDAPYAGIKGAIVMTEEIINSLMAVDHPFST